MCTDEISDLMRKETEAFVVSRGFGIEQGLIASSELRDRARDRVVETSIQGAEIIDADRRIQLQGEVGDGLTHIAIVVHDLRHRDPWRWGSRPWRLAFASISAFVDRRCCKA